MKKLLVFLTSLGLTAMLLPLQLIADTDHERSELATLHQQAADAQNAGDYELAERLHREVVKKMVHIQNFPPNEQARQLSNLASVLNLRGKPAEALPLLRKAKDLLKKQPSEDPTQYSTLYFNLGRAYSLQRAWASAEQQYNEGIEVLTKAGLSERKYLFQADAGLAYVYWKTGRLAEAKTRYEAALQFVRTFAPATHPVLRGWEQEYQAVMKVLNQ